MPTPRRELLDLLDRLCDERTTADEHVRLQELVMADEGALGLYLDYITLHGTLHWDTAVSDSIVSENITPPSPSVMPHPAPSRRLARRRTWMTLSVSAALIAIVFAVLNSPTVDQIAEAPSSHPSYAGSPSTVIDRPSTDNSAASQPVVRLAPRNTDNQATELADNIDSSANNTARAEEGSTTDLVAFIDQQLAKGWTQSELTPSPPADDAEWIRRASLDLAGHIPDLKTVRAFLDNDQSNKREQFVAGLLSGGDFAEHLTTVWANLLVGRSSATAHERRGLEQFLLTEFRKNRPWNEMVGELIAAEGSVDENGAAGFLLAHLNNEAVPATAITARLFLGEQVQCSQCHKHPWNDESQETFWTLNAFFHQTAIDRQQIADAQTGKQKTIPVLVTRERGGPTFFENRRGIMQVAYPQYGGEEVSAEASVNRRRELARLLSEEDGHQLARAFVNRMWAHFFGYGFVNPVDDMGPHQPATHPELLDRLATEFVESHYNVRELVRWITSSKAYHLTSRLTEDNAADEPTDGDPPLFSRMYVKPLAPEQVFDSVLVATDADRAGNRYEVAARQQRQEWVQQFFEVLENEENGELTTFDGTVPQALSMMNGPLVQTALIDSPGTVLHRILTSRSSDAEKLRDLCLAALSREPTRKERNLFTRHLRQATTRSAKTDAFRDIFWAYLNSNEFVVNH